MNTKEKKIIKQFPYELQELLTKKFGAECKFKCFFDFFGSGDYVTTFEAEGSLKKEIENYIAGFMAGWQMLGDKLTNSQ